MFLGRFPIALSTLAGSQSILSGSPEYPSRLPDGLIGLSDGPIRSEIALLSSLRALSATIVLDALSGSQEYPSILPDHRWSYQAFRWPSHVSNSLITLLGSQRALSAIRVLDAPNRLSEEPIRLPRVP